MYILENKPSFNAYHSMSGKKCCVNRDFDVPTWATLLLEPIHRWNADPEMLIVWAD